MKKIKSQIVECQICKEMVDAKGMAVLDYDVKICRDCYEQECERWS